MTILTGLIGHPISHSVSPIIHKYWMDAHGIDGLYKAVDINPDSLEEGLRKITKDGFSGFNVTVPHKIDVMRFCDEVTPAAKKIGAVNTVSIKNGKLYGDNTDSYGFTASLVGNAGELNLSHAVILGCGGAARAIVYGLSEMGFEKITVVARDLEKARSLCDIADVELKKWGDFDFKDASLLVNTTYLGMTGKPPLEVDIENLPKKALVCDIVYAPLMTDFLKKAQGRGNKIVCGIGMLLYQAQGAFYKWHGVKPLVTKELEVAALSG